jgi:hypothetical protein
MFAIRRSHAYAAPSLAAALVALSSIAAAQPAPASGVVGVVGVVDKPRPPAEPPAQVPVQAPAPATPPGGELTAADVANDPVPGFENGRIDPPEGDSTGRQIARGALFVPKLAIDAVLSPFRGAVWANERYHVVDWYNRIFYNDAQTIGLVPTASVDTSLGVTVGARFVDKDLFGDSETLSLEATIGSRYRQIYSASIGTGKRLGERFHMDLDVGYERRPHDAFYGIGNGGRVEAAPAPIDPRVDSTAVQAYYRQYRSRMSLRADLRAWRDLHLRAAGALSEVEFGQPDQGESITAVYTPGGLVGFGGVQYGYGELELRWDSRSHTGTWEPSSVHSQGSVVSAFAGRQVALDDSADFWRYGTDLEHFFRLAEGPRVVIARLHGEAVSGSRDEVPFSELPQLGGPMWLRGYDLDQFRDRVAAFGSLAYEWDLSQWFAARLFTDVGRVYPSLGELSLDHLRMGFGAAIEAHAVDSFLFEASLGSSIDGGLFLNLSFNRVYDLDERVRRR